CCKRTTNGFGCLRRSGTTPWSDVGGESRTAAALVRSSSAPADAERIWLDDAPAGVQTPPISSGGGIAVIKAPTVWAVSLVLLASVALVPMPALAQRGGGMARGGGRRGGGSRGRGGGCLGACR